MIWQDHSVAFSILGLDVRWYGLSYLFGFFLSLNLGWIIFQKLKNKSDKLNKNTWEDLIFGVFFAGIVGGRLGEFLFYSTDILWQNPLEIFKIWHGGMSIHGGLLGALSFLIYWIRKNNISLLLLIDSFVLPLSIGLGVGRITNYLNGELAGQPTGENWGIIFPHVDNLLRHPTQLYESAGSFFLAILLFWLYKQKTYKRGALTILFLTGYGVTRFVIEFWKSPDGWEILGLSTGQWLCLVMIGLSGFIFFKQKKTWK